jgi:Zn-dependent protease with chaperone function
MVAGLFSGPNSIRVRGERAAFVWSLLLAPVTIGLIGAIFKSITFSDLALLTVGGMVYVSIARGRLLGSSVRIDGRQFPEVFKIVETTAARLGVATPQIFVRDDVFVPIAAVGMGAPYALIISSQYLEHLRDGELAFLVGRELAHIAAGHTRLTSLLSASGREIRRWR